MLFHTLPRFCCRGHFYISCGFVSIDIAIRINNGEAKNMKIQKKSLLQRLLKMPRNTSLKPYTTRMAKIQGPNEGKTYSNIYKDKWAHT